jgi:hypothetical protein
MGDDSPEAKQRVKDAQRDMRDFISRTGRTRRPDRESLYGGKKAPTPAKDQRPEQQNVKSQLTTPKIEPVKVEYGQAVDGIRRASYRDGVKKVLDDAPDAVKKAWNATSANLQQPYFDIKDAGIFIRQESPFILRRKRKRFKKQIIKKKTLAISMNTVIILISG